MDQMILPRTACGEKGFYPLANMYTNVIAQQSATFSLRFALVVQLCRIRRHKN